MPDIIVRTHKSYTVQVQQDMGAFPAVLPLLKGSNVAIVCDDNVAPYFDVLAAYLGEKTLTKIVIPAGEAHKNATEYLSILNALAAAHFTRDDAVISLGGGVVGDLAAFAASTYMRGIGLLAVPTSLLAMVDSAVGGKTAINIEYGKNLCGTFYQPDGVYVNTAFLVTLPRREQMCGWGEIIKYAFLSHTITLADLEGDATPTLIAKCIAIKARLVAEDETEKGKRKLLNLGHTIGHAIERLSGFALSHGECVAKGLAAVVGMSRRYYGLDEEWYRRAMAIVSCKGHDLTCPYGIEEIMAQLTADKKSHQGGVDMVLIDADLQGRIVPLSYDEIRNLML